MVGGDLNCSGARVALAPVTSAAGETVRYTLAQVIPPVRASPKPEPIRHPRCLTKDQLALQGSDAAAPTASSPAYTAPVALGTSCRPCSIAARVFSAAGTPLDPITRATYNRTA